jgi:hypothetical protein
MEIGAVGQNRGVGRVASQRTYQPSVLTINARKVPSHLGQPDNGKAVGVHNRFDACLF